MSFYDCQVFISGLIDWFLNSDLFLFSSIILFSIVILIILYFFNKSKKSRVLSISDINAFSITIKLNVKNIDIAYMMYIQLRTRKIGIAFDDEDVLIEVYKSWFTAFNAIRDLLMNIRPNPQNQAIIELGVKVLNNGMRPHLTRWQAKFRKWYDLEANKKDNEKLSPQEIQRKFPEYNSLIEDLKRSQDEILVLLESLEDTFT